MIKNSILIFSFMFYGIFLYGQSYKDMLLKAGESAYNSGNNPEALKNYFASLKIYEEIGYNSGIAFSYNNIGNVYDSQVQVFLFFHVGYRII